MPISHIKNLKFDLKDCTYLMCAGFEATSSHINSKRENSSAKVEEHTMFTDFYSKFYNVKNQSHVLGFLGAVKVSES